MIPLSLNEVTFSIKSNVMKGGIIDIKWGRELLKVIGGKLINKIPISFPIQKSCSKQVGIQQFYIICDSVILMIKEGLSTLIDQMV